MVGAGIMGCAVALELARRGVAVTVIDQRPAPPEDGVDGFPLGPQACVDASSGSWAWLNANGKDGLSTECNRSRLPTHQ